MVQEDVLEHVQFPDKPAKGIPVGNYRLVGWAVDTTGRRLIDEIVQLAAYTPQSTFSQYIMPFGDLNPSYSYRHNIRIFNTIRYRRLKDSRTGRFLKTKSEISALGDFMKWLEEVKGDTDGIILVFHEIRKSSPGMLLEALRRNNYLDQFNKLVKGFANGFGISSDKCKGTTKTFSLRVMCKILLNKDEVDFSGAKDRAKATYDIVTHLGQGERENLDINAKGDSTGSEPHLIELVCPFTNPISAEEEEIAEFKVLLQRQNTFRPVFGAFLRSSRSDRQHASHLRRLLAENDINYEKLKQVYESEAKDGIQKVISEIPNAKENDVTELLEILDCFFDPEKKPVQPKNRYYSHNNNRRPRRKSLNKSRNSESKSANDSTESTNTSTDSTPREKEVKEENVEEQKDNVQSEVKPEVAVN